MSQRKLQQYVYSSIILFSVVLRRLIIGVGLRVVPVQDNWTANIEFDHRRLHLNREISRANHGN